MDNNLYTYLQLSDDYWTVTTTIDYNFEYVTSDDKENESK